MGFGQSPFPVHPRLAEALAAAATRNAYDDVAGLKELRARAKSYFCARIGLDANAYECVVAPGSKLILYALQMAINGDQANLKVYETPTSPKMPMVLRDTPSFVIHADRVLPTR
jgi:aspartate/methionine/tyrosine aminotransferase